MTNILPFPAPTASAPSSETHARFCAARSAMLEAFRAWCEENPNVDDVVEEIDGTARVLSQVAAVVGIGGDAA